MREIDKSPEAQLQVVATNMHLSQEFGETVREIEADGFTVDEKIPSLMPGGTNSSTVRSMAKVEEGLAEAFERLHPDLVVILGDRYETLAAASAAVVFNIPVAHLHGGETTEGAIDNRFRHAITQLSTYHFASTPQYVEKIISMGIPSVNVFHSGAPGAEGSEWQKPERDGMEETEKLKKQMARDFYELTSIQVGEPFILLAFHPVTLLEDKGVAELNATLAALDTFINQGYKVLVTMPNSDPGTCEISQRLKDWEERYSTKNPGIVKTVTSLGSKLFHYALEHASAIVGNSSAALIEAPSHRVGSVNVGIRQKGRAHGLSVIDALPDKTAIEKALEAVMSLEMKVVLMGMSVASLNPYFKEDSAKFIADKLLNINY